jgi:large subunit ribosomal protein L31e
MKEESKKETSKAEDEKKEEAPEEVEGESFAESLEKEMDEEESKRFEEIAGAEEKPSKIEEEAVEEKLPETEKEGEGEEEEKPRREKKAEEEEEVVEEKTYTVPLSKAWIMPANKRAPRAMHILRDYVVKHMKLKEAKQGEEAEEEEPASLIISNEVNEKVWSKGIEKPPRNIRVRAAKDKDGNVTVYLAEGD